MPLAGGVCLAGGIPPAERKLLVNQNTGETYPFGLFGGAWAASYAANAMMQVIVEEIFGLNTTSAIGGGTVDAFYGVMPCTDPTNIADRGCDDNGVAKYHLHMEAWVEGYPTVFQEIQDLFPKSAPVNLGSMGYNGFSTDYLTKAPLEAASSHGMALLYYAYWNASWYRPSEFFDDIQTVNASKWLKRCNESVLADAATAARHVQHTGDIDGVVEENNAYVSLKCDDGYWWASPSCRANRSSCVPYYTGGSGWGVEVMAQRSTLLNMPVAIGVAASWTAYTQFAFEYPGSLIYWWTPDPTFLELAPKPLVYPKHNRKEWAQGLFTSAGSQVPIEKLVSSDLATLAPNVQSFVEKVFISLQQMNDVLLAQKESGETWRNVTCEWLLANEAQWRSWIPDESECFPGFGLFDVELNDYTDSRVNATTQIICEACPSGTFSQALSDSMGDTYTCIPCAPGSAQISGASLSCKECKPGEYQDEMGAATCKRCEIGEYQDELGAASCKSCPSTTITLGLGSVTRADCGCPKAKINTNETGGFTCSECSEGMSCPVLSQLADLKDGQSELGTDYTPQIVAGYYSTNLAPTEVYRCGSIDACPGGTPGTCGGGLIGTPCAKCPEGSTWTGSNCEDCAGWRQALWGAAVAGIFVFLTLAYYMSTSKVTAKATVLFATTASFGMLVLAMQNLGLIGMMTVEWPDDLVGLFSICQFLLLDIDSYGFSCIAGQSAPIRYLLSALIFPVGVLWLFLCWAVSKMFPKSRRWDGSKVVSCMGAFLQVGFSTMSATSLAPMMCYKHPNGQRSILKYPGVICGSSDHSMMMVIGWLLLCIFVLGFVSLCSFAAWKVPSWSARRKDHLVAAVRFLVFRFRLDSWWFGVPLLVRGPLLSLPVVLATDYPPIQIMTITGVFASFLVMQMLAWPWKVPMLNLTDCIITFCITLLVTTSSLFLPPVEGAMAAFAHGISTAMITGIGAAMGFMCLMTVSALFYRGAMGGKKELRIFNLGAVASSQKLALKVQEMSRELERLARDDLSGKLGGLSVFDLNKITSCISLLATEVAPPAEHAITYKFNPRINSSSFDPSLKRAKQSKRSTTSADAAATGKTELEGDNQPRSERTSVAQSEWV